jgi:hypothetical protein
MSDAAHRVERVTLVNLLYFTIYVQLGFWMDMVGTFRGYSFGKIILQFSSTLLFDML